jgi:hypothetical protein
MGRIAETEISERVLRDPGYCTDIRLMPDELAFFRQAIQRQWLDRISEVYPELAPQFAELGLANYHKLAHLVDHQKLWPKPFRVLPGSVAAQVKHLPVMERLRAAFGDFVISDYAYENTIEQGREELYWRIVRPNVRSDVGQLHADKWFHERLGSDEYGMFEAGTETLKIWTAIYCEPGRNGLIIVPNSHKRIWRYQHVPVGNSTRPQILEDEEKLGGILVATDPGTLLIFNDATLHGGAVNQGDYTRVSMEITMVFH